MYEDGALHLQTKSKKYGKLGALRINSAVNMSNHRDHFCGRVIEQAIGVCWIGQPRLSHELSVCAGEHGGGMMLRVPCTLIRRQKQVRDCHHYRLPLPHCC